MREGVQRGHGEQRAYFCTARRVFGAYLGKKYPESYDPDLPGKLVYSGSKTLTGAIEGVGLDAGKLVLSPTRTYAPCDQGGAASSTVRTSMA
jgi:hypothetical protein